MIGLWAYNAPMCLAALKEAGKLKQVKVFSFDEDPAILTALADGTCAGTIVQNPYQMGYQAIEQLNKFVAAPLTAEPKKDPISIPNQIITKDNVGLFLKTRAKQLQILKGPKIVTKEARFAFVTNVADPWWKHAEAGCLAASKKLGATTEFILNSSGSVVGQNKILTRILEQGEFDGIAISPLGPTKQVQILNKVAAKIPLITVDADAPETKRLRHVGTDSYAGGRLMGKLLKKSMPGGGRIMIFVGILETQHASERLKGVLDELKAE